MGSSSLGYAPMTMTPAMASPVPRAHPWSLQKPRTEATIPPTLTHAKTERIQFWVAWMSAMKAMGKAMAMPVVRPDTVPACVTLHTQSNVH